MAENYDRYRPDYPSPMLDDLLAPLDGGGFVLDIGCGTGKVAAAIAARGLSGAGLEPDPDMAAVARRHLEAYGWPVHESDFEACDLPDGSVDLITCGQAWHWIDDAVGYPTAARLLRPGGRLALFWNRQEWVDAELRARLDAVYAEHAPEMQSSLAGKGHNAKGDLPDSGGEPGFPVAEMRTYTRTVTYDRDTWFGLLGTHSDHVLLSEDRREALYAAERAVIDAFGGSMELILRTECWTGTVASSADFVR